MTTKIAIHTRTKTKFRESALELIQLGKAKTSYPRIVERAGIPANRLHAMLSPVTELPGGFTVVDSRDVAKLDAFIGGKGELLAIVEKGAKRTDNPKVKAEVPAKVKALVADPTEKAATPAAAKKAAKKAPAKKVAAAKTAEKTSTETAGATEVVKKAPAKKTAKKKAAK